MICNYSFSHPASSDDVDGTGWLQRQAGTGKRPTERQRQSAATWSGQQVQPLPVLTSPLQNVQPFVDEYRRAYIPHSSVVRNAVAGGVLGAAITYVWRNR